MIQRIITTPFQKFVKAESLAGILLFGTTIIALIWANSPYGGYYEGLWKQTIGISIQNFELKKPLILWINDGLMSIYFFVIGLELKRELLIGELNKVKKVIFPFIAALGGIIVPVGLYFVLNQDPETEKGWAISMATDIAFALAFLSTLGKRIPISLKVFLIAFAIIDDIAAVLVIALFYSVNVSWSYVLFGLLLITLLAILYHTKRYSFAIGIVLAIIIWFLFLKSGVHPTIAGVLLAFTIPLKRKINMKLYSVQLSIISKKLMSVSNSGKKHLLSKTEINYIDNLDNLTFEVRSPLQYLEHKLHSLIAYFILPIFAFANAGVFISLDSDFNFSLLINIAISLFVGKMIGVALFSYLGNKLGIIELPAGVNYKQILGISAIAGIGFTMSIFIGNLAFYGDSVNINSAKIGIIIGSITSAMVGYTILRLTSSNK
ncbi:Na+/H+ antiporter NhaA [Muricauda sp. SCSIO 64092]|uniref:Na+/H+ antiporter NhaA n=1 Tax=Allomuricauda sp. SCSIO 64092 TaxID=2908842 RepID=UPI001FF19C66|nr:Na+/H+ antiporter NhaA [Muricauda sp. SCSIO 64092]UOY06709.1 Na+/H+ antiporter NhaA [Muricauda sp. SCSIO 64092]